MKDQGVCSTCWIYAAVGAIESAYYIANGGQLTKPPIFTEEQVRSCLNVACQSTGWPSMALNFAATNQLSTSFDSSKNCSEQSPSSTVRVARWEQVRQFGWFGLLQAVLQQPVVVFLEASGFEFIAYQEVNRLHRLSLSE